MAVSIAMPATYAQSGHATVVVRPDLHTGKLIRSVVVTPRVVDSKPETALTAMDAAATAIPPSSNLIEMINAIAKAHDVEAPLVHSVIRAESNYNASAVSNKGALGMMQLIPSTARRFGVQNVFDARQNIEGGVKYLRFLLDYFKGDYPKAIAAYNAGEGAVDKYRGIPPYSETRNYVYQVAKNLKMAREAEERSKAASKQTLAANEIPDSAAAKAEVTYNKIQASVSEDGKVIYRTQ